MTDLPDFHIPHAEKIEWMIETSGWAIEPVAPNTDVDPPLPGYAYTIGFPEAFGFPEVLIFGLTPVAARGLFDLVAELLRGGTEVPIGVELVGLFDNELRCLFAPVDLTAKQSGTLIAAQSQRQNQTGDLAKVFVLNGGRDRTRTCDLLRVKNSGSFYPFYLLLWLSTIWGVCFRSADIS